MLSLPPAATAITPERLLTCTGVLLFVVLPLPSSPFAFSPQAQTVPSLFTARLWSQPAAMAITPERLLTAMGVELGTFVPTPNSPKPFPPHAQTVPSLFSDKLNSSSQQPSAIATTPERLLTCDGVDVATVVPFPSSLKPLSPQAQTFPVLTEVGVCRVSATGAAAPRLALAAPRRRSSSVASRGVKKSVLLSPCERNLTRCAACP